MTLHEHSTTDDMVAWLRDYADVLYVAEATRANLRVCANRLEALYMGDDKTALHELARRVTALETRPPCSHHRGALTDAQGVVRNNEVGR